MVPDDENPGRADKRRCLFPQCRPIMWSLSGRPGPWLPGGASASREAESVERQGMPEVTITLESHDEELAVFGSRDQFLRQVRDAFGVKLVARHGEVRVEGETRKVEQARQVLEELKGWHRRRRTASAGDVAELIENRARPQAEANGSSVEIREGGKVVRARTDGQARYLACLRDHELVFCVGPAGTGKTYLAVAQAVAELKKGQIKKIVLVRPAVEAGEHLGFLPGDLEAKINPYLRPLLDALHDLMDYDQIRRYMGNDLIEIAPLAYMRGPNAQRRGDHPR